MGVLFVAVCASMLVNLILLAVLGSRGGVALTGGRVISPKEFEEEVILHGRGSHDKIAVIPVNGVIGFSQEGSLGDSMVEDFKAALQQAADDPHVKAVVVEMDSPGGEVTASDVLYNELKKFRICKKVLMPDLNGGKTSI